MTPDPRRPEYEALWRQARKAVQRGQVKLGYKPSTPAATAAVSALFGRTLELGVGTTIRVADLDERVQAVFHCGLPDVLSAVHGEPVEFRPDQASVDAARREWTDDLLRSALASAGLAAAPWARTWIDQVRRYAKIAPERLETPARQAAAVLARLNLSATRPTTWLSRVELARAAGDPHALDPGRKVATLVLRAAALAHDVPLPRTRRDETHLWERCGITDGVGQPVLVHGFPGLPGPTHLPLRALPHAPNGAADGDSDRDGNVHDGTARDGATHEGTAHGNTAHESIADATAQTASPLRNLPHPPAEAVPHGDPGRSAPNDRPTPSTEPGQDHTSNRSASDPAPLASASGAHQFPSPTGPNPAPLAWASGIGPDDSPNPAAPSRAPEGALSTGAIHDSSPASAVAVHAAERASAGGSPGSAVPAGWGLVGLPRGVVRVCMRARLVEAVADAGLEVPVVCVSGRLNPTARVLVSRLVAAGCQVEAHTDFDPAGLVVMRELLALGATPWRMGADDYREALDHARANDIELPALDGDPGGTPWDPDLPAVMRAGWAVPEEVVTELLLSDL
ncbi:TIGR02679 domain-containing protein [Actinokineospora sp. UTMC 2448]|uniref:TIGR02679 domain-containing protein n=1 Tax=Actinokineospora sp. UTMC 2448 TaxID=2268449 RepID=UPI002164A39C|nr:TIGR02679 domain-containing protein [Actinokineospora sp. UTMC 2448]UVS77219.1 hypothetical protein Actkin_00921 [Actinokineospora sp. UTMC 2448]